MVSLISFLCYVASFARRAIFRTPAPPPVIPQQTPIPVGDSACPEGYRFDDDEEWTEQCKLIETQFVGFVVGFLISMLIQFCILKQVLPVDAYPMFKTEAQIHTLLVTTIFFAVGTVAFLMAMRSYTGSPLACRVVQIAKETAAMASAWNILYLGYWFFWQDVEHHQEFGQIACKCSAVMSMALVFSFAAILLILAVAKVTNSGSSGKEVMRLTSDSLGLLVGFAWTSAILVVIKGNSYLYEAPSARLAMDVTLLLGFCLVILPAWLLYVLPQLLANQSSKNEEEDILLATGGGHVLTVHAVETTSSSHPLLNQTQATESKLDVQLDKDLDSYLKKSGGDAAQDPRQSSQSTALAAAPAAAQTNNSEL